MAAKNLYTILGVERTASAEEIKKAYRRLARAHHPDRNPGDSKAEERFKEISVAYDILADAKKRALYDEFGMEGLQAGFQPGRARAARQHAHAAGAHAYTWSRPGGAGAEAGRSFTDILNEMFSGLGRQARGVPGADIEHPLEITLLDAIRGRSISLNLEQMNPCGACRGSGQAGSKRCPACRGTGALPKHATLSVKIPPGVDTGSRVRIAGKGEPGQFGGPPGDLYLVIAVAAHPFLERKGADLYVEVPVTVREAICGATITVPTPGGKVRVKVPPSSQSGKLLRLRGAGVTDAKTEIRGDLFIRLLVHVPTKGGDGVKEAADALERAYTGDLRRHLEL
jgi:molecular chaperone DnaJ